MRRCAKQSGGGQGIRPLNRLPDNCFQNNLLTIRVPSGEVVRQEAQIHFFQPRSLTTVLAKGNAQLPHVQARIFSVAKHPQIHSDFKVCEYWSSTKREQSDNYRRPNIRR